MNRIESISKILAGSGCGSTFDLFRNEDSDAPVMVQWLWATPQSALDKNPGDAHQRADAVSQSISHSGFEASNEVNDFFCLSNDIEVAPTCPFRPDSCQGSHVVAAGVGFVPDGPIPA
jgi:hypothetical protein